MASTFELLKRIRAAFDGEKSHGFGFFYKTDRKPGTRVVGTFNRNVLEPRIGARVTSPSSSSIALGAAFSVPSQKEKGKGGKGNRGRGGGRHLLAPMPRRWSFQHSYKGSLLPAASLSLSFFLVHLTFPPFFPSS